MMSGAYGEQGEICQGGAMERARDHHGNAKEVVMASPSGHDEVSTCLRVFVDMLGLKTPFVMVSISSRDANRASG